MRVALGRGSPAGCSQVAQLIPPPRFRLNVVVEILDVFRVVWPVQMLEVVIAPAAVKQKCVMNAAEMF